MSHNAAPTVSGASISNTNRAVDALANASCIPFIGPASNQWISGQQNTASTLLIGHATETCQPIRFSTRVSFSGINVLVQTGGTTGVAVLRFGLRADNGSGQPGTLIADYGTFASQTSSTYIGPGAQAGTDISFTTEPYVTYWLSFTPQTVAQTSTAPASQSGYRYQNPPYLQTYGPNPNTQPLQGWRTTVSNSAAGTTTGSLPASITLPANNTGNVRSVEAFAFWLKFA